MKSITDEHERAARGAVTAALAKEWLAMWGLIETDPEGVASAAVIMLAAVLEDDAELDGVSVFVHWQRFALSAAADEP